MSFQEQDWFGLQREAEETSKQLAVQIREKNQQTDQKKGSYFSAAARRKLGALDSKIDQLHQVLSNSHNLSEKEQNRRETFIIQMKNQRQIFQANLQARDDSHRQQLLQDAKPQETAQTAQMNTQELIQLNDRVMNQQDLELNDMEKAVQSTKHITLAMNEELTLHEKLLGDVEQGVSGLQQRLGAASNRIGTILKTQGSSWYLIYAIAILFLILIVVIALIGRR